MSRASHRIQALGAIALISLVAAGCGGGDEAATTPPAPAPAPTTPTPGASTPGSTVAGTPGATDPTTGLPIDSATTGGTGAASATVPDLSGDDLSGGLAAVNGTSIFAPQAVEVGELAALDKKNETAAENVSTTDKPAKPAVTYSGAKIYVDGIVHEVSRNGTFPKSNPVFRLLSVSASDIEIELIAGEFTAGGGEGVVLDKGDLVSLVNASEQLTYRVKYLRPIQDASGISF